MPQPALVLEYIWFLVKPFARLWWNPQNELFKTMKDVEFVKAYGQKIEL